MVIQALFHVNGFNSPRSGHTQTRAHKPDSRTKARAVVKIQQLTQHATALTLEWINPLCHCPPSTVLNSTQLTTWHFLIKAPYLGNLSVIYDAENKGLSYFPSDENKGLKSIAEIRCSVIKSLITDSMASIRLVT